MGQLRGNVPRRSSAKQSLLSPSSGNDRRSLNKVWFVGQGRYWERFSPEFLQEEPYRRLLWRTLAGLVGAVVISAVAAGYLISGGDASGWLLVAGAAMLLIGAAKMFWALFTTRRTPRT
jgi:hypothetical protein